MIRAPRRSRGTSAPPSLVAPPARTAAQIVRDIGTRATALSGRIGGLGSLGQQLASLQTLRLPVGLAGVSVAFESLTTALEARASTDPACEPLLAEVKALRQSD